MLGDGLKKYIMNPCLGLLPLLLYTLLYYLTSDIYISLVSGLIFAVIAEIGLRIWTKTMRLGLMFFVSFISLAITFVLWMLLHESFINNYLFVVFPEIFTVSIIIVMRLSKVYVNLHYFKKENILQKAFINEFFEVSAFIQYFLTIHLFIVLIHKHLMDNIGIENKFDTLIYIWTPIVGIAALIIYESFKMRRIVKKLKKEEWLPIVDEKGQVTGKIAKSVSRQMKNKFLHPVVRIALVCNGKIYLQARSSDDICEPGKIDYPFEKYMLFNHQINLVARNSIYRILGRELPFSFLLKYTYENENTKRLIFLFVSRIKEESEVEKLGSLTGKFWSVKQIESDFGDDSKFSECFQLEFEYLKNTVLLADEISVKHAPEEQRQNKNQENIFSA